MKKLLALVLALVMTLGLATVGTSAAFSDADSVNYTEAVEVMSGIGVLAGMDDGNFNPAGTLTREQGAKIITYMLLGPTAADALTVSKAPFSDVAADRWSAGSIAYCKNNGIINGVGNGNFDPTGTLTGYAFAKMCLVALGYDAAIEGLTGDGWEMGTATLVRKLGLANGIKGFVGSATMTREAAAQVGFNTLKATEVDYTVTNSSNSDGTTSVGTITRAQTVNNLAANDYRDAGTDTAMQLIEDVFPDLKRFTTTDDFGRPAYTWKLNEVTINKEVRKSPIATFTKFETASSISDALANFTYDGATMTVILNDQGVAAAAPAAITAGVTAGAVTVSAAQLLAMTKDGRTVEVYDVNDDYTIDKVVIVDEYLAKVTNKDSSSVELTITVGNTTAVATVKKDNVNKDFYEEASKLNKGDFVLVNAKGDVTVNNTQLPATGVALLKIVGAPTTFTGTVTKTVAATGTASKTDTIAGATYKESVRLAGATLARTNSFMYYVDSLGNVIGHAATTESKDYAFVLGTTTSGNIKDGLTYYAQLLKTDGAKEWVKVSYIDSTAVNSDNFNPNQFASALHEPDNTHATFVTYTVEDGGAYKLSKLNTQANYTKDAKYNVTANITRGTSSYDSTCTLTGNTIFLIANSNDGVFTAYKGISNVPSTVVNHAAVLQTGEASNVARLVVVYDGSNVKDDVVFVYNATADAVETVNSKAVSTYKAIVNGAKTTITTDESVTANTMYYKNTYANGYDYIETLSAGSGYDATDAVGAGGALTMTNAGSNDLYLWKVTLNSDATAKVTADGGVLKIQLGADTTNVNSAIYDGEFTTWLVKGTTHTVSEITLDSTGNSDVADSTNDAIWVALDKDSNVKYVILLDKSA